MAPPAAETPLEAALVLVDPFRPVPLALPLVELAVPELLVVVLAAPDCVDELLPPLLAPPVLVELPLEPLTVVDVTLPVALTLPLEPPLDE